MSAHMLICNEGKEDKQYHIAYQINTSGPNIPYCRMPGYLDTQVQVASDNAKICKRCQKAAGLHMFVEATPAAVETAPIAGVEGREREALIRLRAASHEATSDEAWWWIKKIEDACEEAGIPALSDATTGSFEKVPA